MGGAYSEPEAFTQQTTVVVTPLSALDTDPNFFFFFFSSLTQNLLAFLLNSCDSAFVYVENSVGSKVVLSDNVLKEVKVP